MKVISIGVGDKKVPLVGYLQDYVEGGGLKNIRPVVIVCPGGGYGFLSWREGDHVAMQFLAEGYNVFILRYSVGEDAANCEPLLEASDAVESVRAHAVDWLCDPNRIAILGFSSGGHVAASISTLFDSPVIREKRGEKGGKNRPDFTILCYPVITGGPFRHEKSFAWITKGDDSLRDFFSLEKQVTEKTPPAFIWSTFEDQSVPVENSLLYAEALHSHGVPCELHIFQNGRHGLSTCDEEVDSPEDADRAWIGLCLTWLRRRFDLANLVNG